MSCDLIGYFWKMLPDITLNQYHLTHWGRQNDILKWIFLNVNLHISIKLSLRVAHRGPIINIPALVRIMAWRRPGDKPLSEPVMDNLHMHICVILPQWVKSVGSVTRICFSETLTFGTNSCEICICIKVVSVISMFSNCRVRHVGLFIICVNICSQVGVFSPLLYVHIHCHIHIWRDHCCPLVISLISVRPHEARNNYIISYELWRPHLRGIRYVVTKRVKGKHNYTQKMCVNRYDIQ